MQHADQETERLTGEQILLATLQLGHKQITQEAQSSMMQFLQKDADTFSTHVSAILVTGGHIEKKMDSNVTKITQVIHEEAIYATEEINSLYEGQKTAIDAIKATQQETSEGMVSLLADLEEIEAMDNDYDSCVNEIMALLKGQEKLLNYYEQSSINIT